MCKGPFAATLGVGKLPAPAKVDIAAIQEAQLPKLAKVEAQEYKTFQHPGGDVLFFVAAHLLSFTMMEKSAEEDQL